MRLIGQFGIGRAVARDDQQFLAEQSSLVNSGVPLTVIDDPALITLMEAFTRENSALSIEGIGED